MTVFEWRDLETNPIPASSIPCLEMRDNPDVITPHASDRDLHTMTIALTAISSTIADMRDIIAELEQSVDSDRTWGGLAIDSKILSDEIDIQHYEEKYFKALIPLEVTFVTRMGDPYTKG